MKTKNTVNIAKKIYEEQIQCGKHSFVDFLMSRTQSFKRFQEMSAFVTSVLKASNYPFFVVDTEFNIQYMNPACLKFVGGGLPEMAGRTCKDIFKSNLCQNDCAIQQAMTSRQSVVGKWVQVKDREGKEHDIIVSAGALIDGEGKVLGGFEMWREAMPDTNAAKKIKSLLIMLNDYKNDMNLLLKKLEDKLPGAITSAAGNKVLFDALKKKTEGLQSACDEILQAYCWDINNCPPERQIQCPAFPNQGRNCWEVDYTWCDGLMQGRADEKQGKCAACKVHQDFHTD